MLKVENITKYYGSFKAVDNLSFEVKPGEIFGLLGENGAGKTTTFRTIMGLIEASDGKVTLNDKPIDFEVTNKIGFVTEERSLLTKLTVKEQVLFYGALKEMNEDTILKELDYWLKRFDIENYLDKKIKELSKGNQQKIQFITAVINKPKLLILDEPFSGLDPINVEYLKNAIYDLKKEGCAIIFSSHQMQYIEEFCEKLVILSKGKNILSGYLDKIKKDMGHNKIMLKGDKIDLSKLEKIKGVTSIDNNKDHYIVNISGEDVINKVFKAISTASIQTFNVLEPTLNEIFIEKVGASNES